MNKYIPLSIPNFEGNEKKYVDDALDQGWVSTGGAYITKLESNLSEFLNVDSVAACQSGTSAIHLALLDAGIGPNDVVIVPTLTFIAAVNPVKYQFATPIFMDCDDSLCMDPIKLRKFCEEECEFRYVSNCNKEENSAVLIHKQTEKRVSAVIVVHVFGNMADMESIMEIASQYNLIVIEDATEALGSYYRVGKYAGKYAGTIGDYGAFSFNGNKIITTGGGGAVTAKNKINVEHMKYLSTQSKDDPHYYIHNEIGYNYRMTNLQAALGVAQLEKLPEYIVRKQSNYKEYKSILEGTDGIYLIGFRESIDSNKWFYSLEINVEKFNISLNKIIEKLEENGIQTRAIWGLIHEQKPYETEFSYKIEKAKYYSQHILNIPCSTNLTYEDILFVTKTIIKVVIDS